MIDFNTTSIGRGFKQEETKFAFAHIRFSRRLAVIYTIFS